MCSKSVVRVSRVLPAWFFVREEDSAVGATSQVLMFTQKLLPVHQVTQTLSCVDAVGLHVRRHTHYFQEQLLPLCNLRLNLLIQLNTLIKKSLDVADNVLMFFPSIGGDIQVCKYATFLRVRIKGRQFLIYCLPSKAGNETEVENFAKPSGATRYSPGPLARGSSVTSSPSKRPPTDSGLQKKGQAKMLKQHRVVVSLVGKTSVASGLCHSKSATQRRKKQTLGGQRFRGAEQHKTETRVVEKAPQPQRSPTTRSNQRDHENDRIQIVQERHTKGADTRDKRPISLAGTCIACAAERSKMCTAAHAPLWI